MSKAKFLIDQLILRKAQGNNFQMYNVKMKLVLKGVLVDKITDQTPDTEELLNKIYEVANSFNIELPTIKNIL